MLLNYVKEEDLACCSTACASLLTSISRQLQDRLTPLEALLQTRLQFETLFLMGSTGLCGKTGLSWYFVSLVSGMACIVLLLTRCFLTWKLVDHPVRVPSTTALVCSQRRSTFQTYSQVLTIHWLHRNGRFICDLPFISFSLNFPSLCLQKAVRRKRSAVNGRVLWCREWKSEQLCSSRGQLHGANRTPRGGAFALYLYLH